MSEWIEKPLGELAKIRVSNVDKKSLSSERPVRLCNYMDVYSGLYLSDEVEYMEATASAREIANFALQTGDVIITKDSESPEDIGIPAIIDETAGGVVCGYHLAMLRPDKSKVDPLFLLKQIDTDPVRRYFLKRAAGSTRYALATGTIEATPIRVAPLRSQRAISRVLRALDTQIEATDCLLAKQEKVRTGMMKDLFTRGIDEHGQLRPRLEEAPQLYQKTELGWLPTGWEVSGLKSKSPVNGGHLRTGPFGSSLKIEHWVSQGRPVITIGSLGEGVFELEQLLYVSDETAARLEAYQLSPGDVVFSRVADVGRSVVIEPDNSGWIMSSNLMRIRLDARKVRPHYLHLQLAFDAALRGQIRRSINSGGRDVANAAVLNSLKFVWPTPEEQDLIIEAAAKLNAESRLFKEDLRKLRIQKSGLMQDLLTGKVSVAPLLEGVAA